MQFSILKTVVFKIENYSNWW